MISLILDCSCGMSIYLVCGEKVFSRIDSTQNKHSDELLVMVDDLLKEANLNVNQIDNLCVCIGPGSFTGVRVAISLVKGLAIGTNAKVFTLSNFDVFDVELDDSTCLVLDGFSSFVYIRRVIDGKKVEECVDVSQLKNEIDKNNLKVYVLSEKTQNILKRFEIIANISQNNIVDAFCSVVENSQAVALNQIFPVYLRASQAEIEREKKLKNGSN